VKALTPRVFRLEFDDEILRAFRPRVELDTIERFKQDAPTLTDGTLPKEDDYLAWLCLMQHYRVPTRLLDWTENVLTALYFVVSEKQNVDGELWAMLPLALNKDSGVGYAAPLLGNNPILEYLLREIYWAGTPAALAAELKLPDAQRRPIALLPRRNFSRMVAQRSVFTLHPRPDTGHSIPEVLTDPKHLVRYIVPANDKRQLMADLDRLGINYQSLFPDLEGLARQIVYENRIVGYGAPDPPQCSGPVAPS